MIGWLKLQLVSEGCLNAAHKRSPCKIVMVDTTYKAELSRRAEYACTFINKSSFKLFVQLLS